MQSDVDARRVAAMVWGIEDLRDIRQLTARLRATVPA